MAVVPFRDVWPTIDVTAFVAPDAWVIGDVTVAATVSIFFSAVLRGDIQPIRVGAGSNIQEHALLHTSNEFGPVTVGQNVTVGHRAILHGCTVEDECLIGMGATILDDARIGKGCIIGAHALIPKGVVVPAYSLVLGSPGKVVRTLSESEKESLLSSATKYQEVGAYYRDNLSTYLTK
jgi:carbonic anhydrase/acetyltransferase-like protein (isoleucine patch superfamily)